MPDDDDDRLPCPIADCKRSRKPEHAFCPQHWRAVPIDLRRQVIDAWQERLRTRRAFMTARRANPDAREGDDLLMRRRAAATAAMKTHLQALEDAEAAVEGRGPIDLFAGV